MVYARWLSRVQATGARDQMGLLETAAKRGSYGRPDNREVGWLAAYWNRFGSGFGGKRAGIKRGWQGEAPTLTLSSTLLN